ncbi:glycerol-1-phosphate dehydrogenase [Gemmobacter aquarius]|uniref:Glycerol-1-phosphate dehydrogenase n=1 Tax=Paragemmobacter aquarius TaxID=2169400 RepID=A0A2S0UMX5_9RHOB|nr:iron-containing alcohol dehydrogenase [Gemmobacter aquarius]AWB49157.1 glycerol-1-phosphate dehydrogenase [Gemmobacter aquarius]
MPNAARNTTAQDPVARAVAQSKTVAEVLIAPGAIAQTGALYTRHFTGPACLIADENTWAAAGPQAEAALHAAGIATRRHILPAKPRPKPTVDLANALRDALHPGETPVAIGSGVLNDVTKHAAFDADRPYLCIGTAASMDGYTSAGAPLSDKGFKKTIQCRPARAVLGDLDIIAAAPPAMTGWGYGDLAGKIPAGGDWIIADTLGVEAIDDVAWPLVQGSLRAWLGQPAAIAAGDPAAISGLFTGLTLVGLAMELHGSSRPASGADHQIAHLWEMDDLMQGGERVSHGACVAVGCTMTLRLYDWLLAQDLSRLDPALADTAPTLDDKIAAILAAFGPGEIATRAIEETRAKHIDRAAHRARIETLRAEWPRLQTRLRAQLMPADQMRAALHAAGAPADAAEIGVDRAYLQRTTLNARFLRSRYTLLDLLDETGLLAQAVNASLPSSS